AALACGGNSTSAPRCMTISNNPIVPAPMNGPNSICPGALNVKFDVPAVTGASGYNWTVSTGLSIVETPPYTNEIHINFPATLTNPITICAYATTPCGTSAGR